MREYYCGPDCVFIALCSRCVSLLDGKIFSRFVDFFLSNLVRSYRKSPNKRSPSNLLKIFRTPIQSNSPWYSSIMLLVFVSAIFSCLIHYLVICLFIEISAYTKAFIRDIKAIFGHLDQLVLTKRTEWMMVERCRNAIELHGRVYG